MFGSVLNVIVSDYATTLFDVFLNNVDREPPVLLIDKNVEVKQLEVAQFELLIIRYDKGMMIYNSILQTL